MRTINKNHFVVILLAALIMTMIGCAQKDSIVGPVIPTESEVNIVLKVNGKSVAANDTIYVMPNVVVELSASNAGSGKLTGWTWYFPDTHSNTGGAAVSHTYTLATGTITEIAVTAYDSLGQGHSVHNPVKMVGEFNPVKNLWVESVEKFGDLFKIVWGVKKTSYLINDKGDWAHIGDPTGSWTVAMPADPIDTNYTIANGVLIPAGTAFGGYIKITMYLPADTLYSMGIGKLRNGNPDDMVWGAFPGEFTTSSNLTLIKFRVLADGQVVPTTTPAPPPTMPGVAGDEYVRSDVDGGNLLIYVNTGSQGVNPFVRITNNSNTLMPAKMTTALTNFPGWSMYIISLADLPGEKLVTMHYGNNISFPDVYNANEVSSKYWNKTENILKFQILTVVLPKTSGQGFIKFSMIPA